ncbi:GNAT family N-acetyltransferase [Streptomyces sp. NPDC004284]|uniref:GNAT family N-acetyltransferase n=1 Tax=Streptomyces sp. NPDC004284 TaxID=3364695 RepID=UPI0036B9BC09
MTAPAVLHVAATPDSPALVLRPWRREDASALVEVSGDPGLRLWETPGVDDDAHAARWVRVQQQGWAAGNRLGFAVLEVQPGSAQEQLVGSVVLKEAAPGRPAAEVGYWTAARARGRGVAPRALEAVTAWAFDSFEVDGLERLELLHQVDNPASCRVAQKSGYDFDRILPASPPAFPHDGHLHVRRPSA